MEFDSKHQIRHALEYGTSNLDLVITARLARARNNALSHQKVPVIGLSLAGIGSEMGSALLTRASMLMTIAAFILGMVGTYYWNIPEQVSDYADIDSALLADELPIAAYTDQGFQAWLEHPSQ